MARKQQNMQWVVGLHAVQSLLKTAPQSIVELRLQQGRDDRRLQKLQQQAERAGVATMRVDKNALQALVGGGDKPVSIQGVAALCEDPEVRDEGYLRALLARCSQPFVLVLDGVTDPHNLGACLRSADAAGVNAVVVPKDKSAGITPTVRKVACGAAETVPVVAVTNLSRTLKAMQQQGLWIVGTAGEAETELYQADLKGPLALVMGAEEKGMRRLTRGNCDSLVKLPMAGSVSSLNVSVATGICLFEVVRQRGL